MDDFWDDYGEIEAEPFPFCCGIDLLCCFPLADYSKKLALAISFQERKAIREAVKEWLERYVAGKPQYAWVMATLTCGQQYVFGSALRFVGFKRVRTRRNPNSKNTLYFYILEPKIKGIV